MFDLQERTFGWRSRKRHPGWHVRRLAHPRHVRATDKTRRALNRGTRDSDTRGFHGLSNGRRLCRLFAAAREHVAWSYVEMYVRQYWHCSGCCSGPGVWPPERGPRVLEEEVLLDPPRGGRRRESRKSRARRFLSLLHRLRTSRERRERDGIRGRERRENFATFVLWCLDSRRSSLRFLQGMVTRRVIFIIIIINTILIFCMEK